MWWGHSLSFFASGESSCRLGCPFWHRIWCKPPHRCSCWRGFPAQWQREPKGCTLRQKMSLFVPQIIAGWAGSCQEEGIPQWLWWFYLAVLRECLWAEAVPGNQILHKGFSGNNIFFGRAQRLSSDNSACDQTGQFCAQALALMRRLCHCWVGLREGWWGVPRPIFCYPRVTSQDK